MTNHKIFAYKTLLSIILYLLLGCCFGNMELYGANAQNTHRYIHKSCSQFTLKDVIERYFWNGLTRK